MKAFGGLLSVLAISLIGCAEAPKRVITPAAVAAIEVHAMRPAAERADGDTSPALARLVARVHRDARNVLVFATECKTSKSVAALDRAGMHADCTEDSFAQSSLKNLRRYDVVVLDKAPNEDEAGAASVAAFDGTSVMASWRGEDAVLGEAIEVLEDDGANATHHALWLPGSRYSEQPAPIRMNDLGVRPRVPAFITMASDGTASVVGTVRRLPNGAVAIENSGRRAHTRVILGGAPAQGLGDAKMARVRGRIRFEALTTDTYVWEIEVTNVDAQLDDAKMRALEAQHAKLYDGAVEHIGRGELADAAEGLERAAAVFEKPLGDNAWSVVPLVRFDRTMAVRLREVHAGGGRAETMFERVTNYEGAGTTERKLLVAAGLFARAQLLNRYHSATSREEAEQLAHLYFHTVTIVQGKSPFPPPCTEMMDRFWSLRSSGGNYRAPRWKDEGSLTLR